MNYNSKELESLEFYTSRKSHRYLDYEEVNGLLKLILNPNDICNYNWRYIDYKHIEEILYSVYNLYCLCCKYGHEHNIPKTIYRQEHHYNNILAHTDKNSNLWITESFLSFTKDLCEVERFKFSDSAKLLTATVSNDDIENNRIPFIDVTDVLGEDEALNDEKEILIPPFIPVVLDSEAENIKILSDDYIYFYDGPLETIEESLGNFIESYKKPRIDFIQFNDSRKKLNESFSKILLKEKTRIMS